MLIRRRFRVILVRLFLLSIVNFYESAIWPQTASPEISGRVSILDFGGSGDGTTDNTAALNAAINAAMSKSYTIFFPCGAFRFASRPNPIGSGIKIVGCGSVGSTVGYGSSLIADYDEGLPEQGFLTWDGSFGSCCAGTGGGIEQVSIYKGLSRSGGTAIKITGSADGHRAGYSTLSNVLVSSIGDATWDHNLIIDGGCCTTIGSQGVRDTYINDFWAAQATTPNQSILFRGAVQVFWHGGEVIPAHSGANSGMTITGGASTTQQSVNIFVSDVYIAGALLISNAKTISFRGYVGGDVTVDKTSTDVVLAGIVGGRISNQSISAMFETNQVVSLPPNKGLVLSNLSTGSTSSTDLAGQIQLASGKGGYKFKRAYATAPLCVAQDATAPRPVAISVSTTTLSLAGTGSDVVTFICIARK